jgi:hypothetical protein
MVTATRTKTAVTVRAQQLIAGTAKHLGNVTNVTLLGSAYTPAQLTTQLQRVAGLYADVDTAKAATATKLAARKAGMSSIRPLMQAFETYVKATYGGQPDVLGDFGVTPKAKKTLTVEEKAAAAAKRKATREARGTKGSVQKQAIKGDVAGITVTPVKTQIVVPVTPSTTGSTPAAGTTPAPVVSPPAKAAT